LTAHGNHRRSPLCKERQRAILTINASASVRPLATNGDHVDAPSVKKDFVPSLDAGAQLRLGVRGSSGVTGSYRLRESPQCPPPETPSLRVDDALLVRCSTAPTSVRIADNPPGRANPHLPMRVMSVVRAGIHPERGKF
jgi:hypothetical protein